MMMPVFRKSETRQAQGHRGIVATVHPLASEAGLNSMQQGGNAVDAAIAAALTLGVVDGFNSGIGGGCFMLIRRACGEIIAIDGRETAPAAATPNMYLRNGVGDTRLSQTGALASAVPSALAVFADSLKKYGKRTLTDAILPAAEIAETGFPIDFVYARNLQLVAADLKCFESSRSLFFKGDGAPLVEGDLLRQADLAGSYRAIAEQGPDWFYRGPYARAVSKWMNANGGILTEVDFANYRYRTLRHFSTNYRGHDVVCLPPPSSGGVHVAQILNILENFDLRAATEPGLRHHILAEAMKLAFADRAFWLGDPDYVNVPLGLLEKSYARELANRIDPDRVTPVPSHGMPPRAETDHFTKQTTHVSTADAEGNWVALTITINTAFGSKVIVPGTGILLNNEMDDFAIDVAMPNAFSLVGGDANAVAANKRPLSSMSPTLVLNGGQPTLALGGAGGPTIISQTVLNLVGVIDLGLPLDQTLARPRLHHQWQPDKLRIEADFPEEDRIALEDRGHQFKVDVHFGASTIVGRSADGNGLIGAGEPRTTGIGAGF